MSQSAHHNNVGFLFREREELSCTMLVLVPDPLSLLNRALEHSVYSVGVEWMEHEADHSCPSNAEARNVWSLTSIVPEVFVLWWLSIEQLYL